LPDDTPPGPAAPLVWRDHQHHTVAEADAYDRMITTLRDTLDKIAIAKPDPATLEALTQDLAGWSKRLVACAVPEDQRMFGWLSDRPGRGQTMSPCLRVEPTPPGRCRGKVTFGEYFLGVNRAVHGGCLPLLFDEVLGRAAISPERPRFRTAYLNVSFRALTPIDTELEVSGWLERVEGRKVFLRGELRHGDVLCADAEGLFVALKPEQG
jgi:hypothetical protein